MKNLTDSSVAKTANGKKLDNPIKYEFSWSEFADYAEVVSEKKVPTEAEIVSFLNSTAKSNARQAALTAALTAAGIEKPTIENDPQLRLRTVYKSIMAGGDVTEAEARAMASQVTKVQWAE
jgi:hypothetical protein